MWTRSGVCCMWWLHAPNVRSSHLSFNSIQLFSFLLIFTYVATERYGLSRFIFDIGVANKSLLASSLLWYAHLQFQWQNGRLLCTFGNQCWLNDIGQESGIEKNVSPRDIVRCCTAKETFSHEQSFCDFASQEIIVERQLAMAVRRGTVLVVVPSSKAPFSIRCCDIVFVVGENSSTHLFNCNRKHSASKRWNPGAMEVYVSCDVVNEYLPMDEFSSTYLLPGFISDFIGWLQVHKLYEQYGFHEFVFGPLAYADVFLLPKLCVIFDVVKRVAYSGRTVFPVRTRLVSAWIDGR